MSGAGSSESARSEGPPGARRMLGEAQQRADRLLDEAQARVFRLLWHFLPEPAIARNLRFQHLLASRFLSDAGQQSVAFGALVAVTRGGASSFQVALVGVAGLLPPAVFGLYGGAVADALPKRVALAGVYTLQALLCFLVPALTPSHLVDMLFLLLAVGTLGQVSGPTESSVLPLVASKEELASGASLLNLASAAGSASGTALLAPVLVRAVGVEPVLYLAGVFLLLAASRVFDLRGGEEPAKREGFLPRARVGDAVQWLAGHPAVATMIVVSVLSGMANLIMQTLGPKYVQSVLDVDAADAAYVFAPSAIGLVLALVLAPSLMKIRGERLAALFGFFVTAMALFLLGTVGNVAVIVDPINPLRVLGVVGIDLGERLRTAAFMALPLAFGVSLTAASVQTYINRRVPLSFQGRTFAMQGWLRSGAAIIPLLALGALASEFGVDRVLLVLPFVLLAVAYTLVLVSIRIAGVAPPSRLEVLASFWQEPEGAGAPEGGP